MQLKLCAVHCLQASLPKTHKLIYHNLAERESCIAINFHRKVSLCSVCWRIHFFGWNVNVPYSLSCLSSLSADFKMDFLSFSSSFSAARKFISSFFCTACLTAIQMKTNVTVHSSFACIALSSLLVVTWKECMCVCYFRHQHIGPAWLTCFLLVRSITVQMSVCTSARQNKIYIYIQASPPRQLNRFASLYTQNEMLAFICFICKAKPHREPYNCEWQITGLSSKQFFEINVHLMLLLLILFFCPARTHLPATVSR